ncbi:MAG: hypothetical protein LBS21_16355 [Clostridiales bacterium]|jgi:AraC-like DNA-binding protein|nr:hypothetical protein [Clostridiales bacterium]
MDKQENVEVMQRMQDYIEQNIGELITLRDLSNSAGYSPFHSARMINPVIRAQ